MASVPVVHCTLFFLYLKLVERSREYWSLYAPCSVTSIKRRDHWQAMGLNPVFRQGSYHLTTSPFDIILAVQSTSSHIRGSKRGTYLYGPKKVEEVLALGTPGMPHLTLAKILIKVVKWSEKTRAVCVRTRTVNANTFSTTVKDEILEGR